MGLRWVENLQAIAQSDLPRPEMVFLSWLVGRTRRKVYFLRRRRRKQHDLRSAQVPTKVQGNLRECSSN